MHQDSISTTNNRRGLTMALIITAGIMLVEFFGGLMTNSLALLSDSGHMLSDVTSLALSLTAIYFVAKPPSGNKHFGYYRIEVLAALLNGLTLFVIAGFIIYEAYLRFWQPQMVESQAMMQIAAIGLLANLVSAWILWRNSDIHGNINIRSAYLHIVGDALGSIGAIIAGLLMLRYSWYVADPIISVIVALIILKGAWKVVAQSVHILMEGAPSAICSNTIKTKLEEMEGVCNVQEIRVWTLTSGVYSLCCHLIVKDGTDNQALLKDVQQYIQEYWKVRYSTVQIEKM